MIKRLLNPHILLKITLILTTLLLLPTSSWANVKFQTTGAPFKPDGAPQSGTQKYEWNVNRTSSKWEISFGASLTLTDTGFKANLYDTSTNRSVSISGLTKPTSGTCKIKKICLSGSNLSNCNITTIIGDSYQFQRSGTTGDFSPNGNDTYYQWSDNSSSINITIARNSSDVEITVSSITVEVTDIDDDNTEFRWPESVNGFVFNHDFNRLTVDAGLLQTFSYPLELSDFSGVTAASTSRNVTYRSSEQQIATIDNGEITLRKIGETVITATVNDNNDYHYTNGHKEYSFTLKSIFQGPTLSLEEGIQNFGSPIYMSFPGDYNAVSIKYKWQDESEQTYDPQNPPTVKAGELTAWGEITNNGTIIKSEVVTATYVASYDITIAGTAVTSNNAGNILSGGVNNEKVSYNHEKNTLTLNSAKLTDDIVCNTTSLFIDIQGHNTITTNGKPAITTTLETGSPKITIKSTSETKGSLVLKNTSTETPCGGVFRGSSTIITVYTDNPIATLLPTDPNNLTSDTTHIAVFGEFYNLTIGNMKVGSTNTTDILGDGKVTYNPDKQTLSLNGVTIPRIQCTANHPLKIEISGTNTVGMMSGSGYENNTLTITKKKGDSSSASLDVDSNGEMLDGMSPICHFSKCTWDEGLYLNAYTYTYNNDVPEKTSISGVYYGKKGSNYNFISPAGDNIGGLTFSENKPTATPSIWIGGLEPNGEGKFTFDSDSIAGASFDANSNTLTLSGALFYYKGGNIVSSLPSLTIKLTGGNSSMGEYKIINTNPQATLKFTTNADNPGYLSNSLGNNNLPWEGFAGNPTFENKLVYLPNHDTQFIKVLEAPTINYSDGNLIFGGLSDGYGQNYFDCHYTITYGDGSTDSGQNNGQVPSLSVPKQQLAPCTITAYAEFTDQFNNKTTSDIATAYYFGFADALKTTFNGVEREIQKSEFPALVPAVDNIDFMLSNSNNPYAICLETVDDINHIMIKGFGTADLILYINHDENINILNSGDGAVALTANVIPSAPTFSVEAGTYNEAQTLTLTSPYKKSNSDDQTVINIKYCTSEDPDKTNIYTEPISITHSTTITAWVEALVTQPEGGSQKTYTSDILTQEYIIKEDAFIDFMQEENGEYSTIEADQEITGTFGSTNPKVVMPYVSDLKGTIKFTSSNETVVTSNSISLDKEYTLKYTIVGAGQTSIQAVYTPTEDEPILPTTRSFNLKIAPRDITNATISMGTNGETSYVYKGVAIEPITSVSLAASEVAVAATLNAKTDFDLSYYMVSGETENTLDGAPTNVGSYKVTVYAKGNYTGSKSATFTITPATITPTVEINGWTYGTTANTPSVSGNTGNGEVTYAYKLQNEAESAFAAAVPTNAGAYTVKASIAATANYEAASDTAQFVIAKATPTLSFSATTASLTMDEEVTGLPTLSNPSGLAVTYASSNSEVATISEDGTVTPVAPGETTISATIATSNNYEGISVSYVLTVNKAKTKYNLWVEGTQVTEDNAEDILNATEDSDMPLYLFNAKNNTLIINKDQRGSAVIESRLPELKVYIMDTCMVKSIYYNPANTENTGTLTFTCNGNYPGNLTIANEEGISAIKGFSSVSYEYSLTPTTPKYTVYKDGQMMKGTIGSEGDIIDTVVADSVIIGIYIAPLTNGETNTVKKEEFEGVDVSNYSNGVFIFTLNPDNENPEEGDGIDTDENGETGIFVGSTMTDNEAGDIASNVNNKELTPGDGKYAEEYDGITFMVPAGNGVIKIDQIVYPGYEFHLKIGTGAPTTLSTGDEGRVEANVNYQVDEPTYCYLYMVEVPISARAAARGSRDTRLGKRDRAHGKIFSVTVSPNKLSAANTPAQASGGIIPPSEEQGDEIEAEGIQGVKVVNTVDDRWFTIDGRQVDKPTQKGLYIHNRKKVVVK